MGIRYIESVEESLNDTAHLIASFLESEIKAGTIQTGHLNEIFINVKKRNVSAVIRRLHKHYIDINVYVVNEKGVIVYDSRGIDTGNNFSRWNDVYLTLRGKYGARISMTYRNPYGALYVAAPIRLDGKIIGAVTVEKPKNNINRLIDIAKNRILLFIGIAFCLSCLLVIIISFWITVPITHLMNYVRKIKQGKKTTLPALGAGEIKELGIAFEDLVTELEGKKYIEHYVQTLTHEIKSPLSSIRGAAELLEEDVPEEQKRRFYANIKNESKRIEILISRLLELSSLENRRELKETAPIDLEGVISEVIDSVAPQIQQKKISINCRISPGLKIKGELFLLRHSLINLLNNALRFTAEKGEVTINAKTSGGMIMISIIDSGEGIPVYALNRIFEKFYSIPPAGSKNKGTGLGLAFVQEAMKLHGGRIEVVNNSGGGVKATLYFPVFQ